jgi:hypothetical protein
MTEIESPRFAEQSMQEIASVRDDAPLQVRVGFDPVDNLPLATTVSGLCAVAGKHAIATATEIAEQGRGAAACRRLLARDIVICRSELRYFQALRSTIVSDRSG